MAGFLESLGAGLRYGGGALAGAVSPDVYREQSQERGRVKEAGRDRQAKVAEIMLQAAHNGQIPEEHLPEIQQALGKMGYELPLEALRATPDARQKLSEYARLTADRAKADAAGTELANYGQPDSAPGLGMPGANTGLRGGAPMPIQPVSLPPRPSGMPDQSANPPGIQTFPLAPPDRQLGTPSPAANLTVNQQDQVGDIESQTSAFGHDPAYPAEIIPPGPPVTMRPGEIGQLAPVEVIGRRPQAPPSGTVSPIVQDAPSVTPPAIEQAIPPGTSKMDLMEWYKKAMVATQRGVPGAKDVLDHVMKLLNPTKSDLITVGEGQTLFDPRTRQAVFQGTPKAKTHVVDGALVDETGNVIYKGAPEQLKVIQAFNGMLDQAGITDPAQRQQMWADYAGRTGTGGNTNINFGGPTAGVDAQGKPVFFQPSNKGGAPNIMQGVAPAPKEGKPLTESQAKATSFGMRAQAAHDIATQIEGSNQDVGTAAQAAKDAIPGGNYITSSDMQRYNQAKREFVNAAVLRQDSGAAINAGEYNKYNSIYFPQPGDSKETIAQKAASRETAVQGLAVGAGESGKKAQFRVQGSTIQRPDPKRGSMGTAAGFAPPKDAPAGTKFYGYDSTGARTYKMPEGTYDKKQFPDGLTTE